MKPWMAAVFGGVAVSGVILGVRVVKILRITKNAEDAAAGDAEAQSAIAVEAQGLRTRTEAYVRQLAEEEATRYMADVYGLTPERIAGIKRLATVFGQ